MRSQSIPFTTEEQIKTCCRCGESKPISEFYRAAGGVNKVRAHCKRCHLKGQPPEDTWTARAKGLRKRHSSSVSVPELRASLGEPESCHLCNQPLGWEDAVIDHFIPVAQGGSGDPSNLRWAHRWCNAIKGNMTIEELVGFARHVLNVYGEPRSATAEQRNGSAR